MRRRRCRKKCGLCRRKKIMQNAMEVCVDDETKLTLQGLLQYYVKLQETEKNRKMSTIFDKLEINQVVIFVKSVSRAIKLNKLLVEAGFPSIDIHSNIMLEEPIRRYKAFKTSKFGSWWRQTFRPLSRPLNIIFTRQFCRTHHHI